MPRTFLLASLLLSSLASRSQTLAASPNPFHSRTLVSYTITTSANYTLTLTNSVAQIVQTLKSNQFLTAGAHQDSLIMTGFPDGTYFLHLIGDVQDVILKVYKSPLAAQPNDISPEPVEIYPNPTVDNVRVRAEYPIAVWNASGMELSSVYNCISGETEIALPQPGLYIIGVQMPSRIILFKVQRL
jgi:hypothetical protein